MASLPLLHSPEVCTADTFGDQKVLPRKYPLIAAQPPRGLGGWGNYLVRTTLQSLVSTVPYSGYASIAGAVMLQLIKLMVPNSPAALVLE